MKRFVGIALLLSIIVGSELAYGDCWLITPNRYPTGRITYQIHYSITFLWWAEVNSGMQLWNNNCVTFSESFTSQTIVKYNVDLGWIPLEDPPLARTTTYFSLLTGIIEYSVMDLNTNTYCHWSISGYPWPGEFDVRSVVVHEAGHFLRIRDGGDVTKTMGRLPPGVLRRLISTDVRDCPCVIYGSPTPVRESEILLELTLEQNYPNPFNPSTIISFTVPERGPASVRVYDIVGREVATLLDVEEVAPGSYSVMLDAAGFASGTYIYRLQTAGAAATKKMVLFR